MTYQSKVPKLQSKLSNEEIEMLLEQKKMLQQIKVEQATIPGNVYNRDRTLHPRTKIGNWYEDKILYETRVELGLNPEEDKDISAASIIKDIRIKPRDHYSTCNREYGVQLDKLEQTYKDTLSPEEFTNKQVQKIEIPKEEKLYVQRYSHDVVNASMQPQTQISSTTRTLHKRFDDDDEQFHFNPYGQVTVHNIVIEK